MTGHTADPGSITLEDLMDQPMWVAWQNEIRLEGKRPTKVPYAPSGRKAASDDPTTWGTWDQAADRADRLPLPCGDGGVGIMFSEVSNGLSLAGVDLDTCFVTDGPDEIAPWGEEVIDRFSSYTEFSPSGTGVKIFFLVKTADLPAARKAIDDNYGRAWKLPGEEHPPGIELRLGRRFFTVTAQHVSDTPTELHLVDLETVLWLVHEHGPKFLANSRDNRVGNSREYSCTANATSSTHAGTLAAALNGKRQGGGWIAHCPAHDDQKPSLSVSEGDGGKVLVHCHAGCSQEAVIAALKSKGLWESPRKRNGHADDFGRKEEEETEEQEPEAEVDENPEAGDDDPEDLQNPVAVYDYQDGNGHVRYRIARYDNPEKTFRPLSPDGSGGWLLGLEGREPLPYRLPEMKAASKDDPVFICEGEKDADNLVQLGLIATTSHGGVGQATKIWPVIARYFKGRQIVILPDNDTAGAAYAETVRTCLTDVAACIKRVQLPGLPPKGDVSDWLEAGGTAEKLMQLAEQAPEWEPVQATVKEPSTRPWPTLGKAAYYGLAGEIVKAIEPHSEADPAALLIQFLVAFGNVIGRGNCYVVESSRHYANLFAVMVGDSAKARKGSSWNRVEALFAPSDDWRKRVQTGLSTGEGLIAAVRDPAVKTTTDKEGEIIEEVIEEGVADKRLLVIEEEFARMLAVMARPGNTLSPIVRNGWDGRDLQTMTKTQPMRATAPHISIIGHSTLNELKRNLTATEAANGFANRFLLACVRRSKELPFGGQPDDDIMRDLEFKLRERVNAARHHNPSRPPRVFSFDRNAAKLWCEIYGTLSAPAAGLFGAVIARGEAQVVRLALLFALLDGADAIGKVHLEAALELWCYCEDSAAYIFGDALGDDVADTILAALRAAGSDGMTRTAISQLFSHNQSSGRIQKALTQLAKQGLVAVKTRQSGGRPSEVWTAR